MKIQLVIVIYLFLAIKAHTQPFVEWASKYNSFIGNDFGNDITVDAQGNVYVTGVNENYSSSDYITIKYSPSGNIFWTQSYNGTANLIDEALAIEIDGSGNVIVTGKSKGLISGNSTGYDIVTIKYDQDGIPQWLAVYNGTANSDDIGYDLISDNSGNIYVCGSVTNSGTNTQGIVLKYSSYGSLQWTKHLDSGITKEIIFNNYGNIIVSNGTTIAEKFKIFELSPNQGNQVFKYNTYFDVNNQVSGFPDKILCDKNGSIYALSSSSDNINPNLSVEINISKFSHANGTPVWTSTIAADAINGTDIKLDGDLNLFVLADHKSGGQHKFQTLKYNSGGILQWEKFSNPASGVNDFAVALSLGSAFHQPDVFVTGNNSSGDINTVKYSSGGLPLGSKIYNCYSCSTGPDVATAMISDRCDKIYITGYSNCDGTGKDIRTIKYSVNELPTINIEGSNSICLGDEITLSVEACEDCTYLWSTGHTSNSITLTPSVSNIYSVIVTNSENCSTNSMPVTIYVNPHLTPVVNIVATRTSICSGENVAFTANPVDGGVMPVYNWYVDGILRSDINSRYFYSNTLVNGSQVYCVMTSTALCFTSLIDTSNIIMMTVDSVLTASVLLEASATSVCEGEEIFFTAIPSNGGTLPTFEWYIDDEKQLDCSSAFSSGSLIDGSKVRVVMTSNKNCVHQKRVISNSITINTKPLLTPSVIISASENPVCKGENVAFTSLALNGGSTPVFEWYVNDEIQTENSETFIANNLTDGSLIKCKMTSNSGCLTEAGAFSNIIGIGVEHMHEISVKIQASSDSVWACENVVFSAISTDENVQTNFTWFVDGNETAYGPLFSSDTLIDGSRIYCMMFTDEVCVIASEVYSDTILISIKPLPVPEVLLSNDTIFCNNYIEDLFSYMWFFNGEEVSSHPFLLCDQFGNGLYSLVISNFDCSVVSDTIDVDCFVSWTEDINDANTYIYPNPANRVVNIINPYFKNKTVKTEILDMPGRNLIGDFITFDDKGEGSIIISSLKDGAYILLLTDVELRIRQFYKLLISSSH